MDANNDAPKGIPSPGISFVGNQPLPPKEIAYPSSSAQVQQPSGNHAALRIGLGSLAQVDQLLLKQRNFSWFEIQNSIGHQIYYATRDRDCCGPFVVNILDNTSREVISLTHSSAQCSSCCSCCLQEMEVQSPPGNVIGYVVQMHSLCSPWFEIISASRETIFLIERPFCIAIGSDVEFKVLSADGANLVGTISKQGARFAITWFSFDLDVDAKATMLGAAFLMDYMFFQRNGGGGVGVGGGGGGGGGGGC